MKKIIISAHGGRWSDQQKNLPFLRNGIKFFVQDGEILYNDAGYAILNSLKVGTEPTDYPVVESLVPGKLTYDYACWFAEEFSSDCGIYEFGTGSLLKDLTHYTADAPLLLNQIFSEFPNSIVYWVCCREISDRAISNKLINSKTAFHAIE